MGEPTRAVDRAKSRRRFIKGVLGGSVGASMAATVGGTSLGAQGSGPIRAFDHVSLPMRNTDAMLRFYRALGLPVNEGPQICSVHIGDQKINLHRPEFWQSESFTLRAPAAEPPCGDYCVVWEGTVESLRQLLDRVGAEVIEGPVERVGGGAGGAARGTSHYIRDPDGNLVEFIIY